MVAAVLCLALPGCERAKPRPEVTDVYTYFCADTRADIVPDTTVMAPNTQGLNEHNYHKSSPYEDAVPMRDLRIDLLPQYRRSKHNEWLRGFFVSGDIPWGAAGLSAAVDSSTLDELLQQHGSLSRFISLEEHKASADCKARLYRYAVRFWVVKQPLQAFGEPFNRILNERGEQLINDRLAVDSVSPRVVINTSVDLIVPLESDRALQARLRDALRPEDVEFAQRYLPQTWNFLQSLTGNPTAVFSFRSGDYHLTAEMSYAVDMVVRTFARQAGDQPYEVIVRGYADSQALRGPVSYVGGANLSATPVQVLPYDTRRLERGTIESNQALSVARGYAGAVQVSKALDGVISSSEQRRRIRVSYSGGGAIQGPVEDSFRRIDIIFVRAEEAGR